MMTRFFARLLAISVHPAPSSPQSVAATTTIHRSARSQRFSMERGTGWGFVTACCLLGLNGCDRSDVASTAPLQSSQTAHTRSAVSDADVAKFCGDCHATPPASSFARKRWVEEVALGYSFFYASGRSDLKPPAQQRVVEYYQARAPERLEFAIPPRTPSDKLHWKRTAISNPNESHAPGVSHVAVFRGASDQRQIVFCDMALGGVHELELNKEGGQVRTLTKIPHPCHVAQSDLDSDGRLELVATDLGSFRPVDHSNGQVLWIPPGSASDQPVVLDSGLGRVADVRPGDFDADGDQDLIVAEFGWRDTGRILLLENRGMQDGKPQMQRHVIDKRHGAIHTIPTDLNADGRLDFVALIAQEHESVEAFLGAGPPLSFERHVLYSGSDPAFGSSGIELVDLDLDQDLDVIFTNGDAFDSDLPKPYHGIHWLENKSKFPFTYHQLALMPGVHRALPGDLDRDGDLDLVATAHLPGEPEKLFPEVPFDSIVWLEQTEPGKFEVHPIEANRCHHPSCALDDLDSDGDLDILVGEFPTTNPSSAWVSVWWNEG